jgi:hypothetical protein
VKTARRAVGRMRLVLGALSAMLMAGLAGCNDAVTAPRARVERGGAVAASAEPSAGAGRQVFRGPSGRVYLLDLETSTLSEPGGRSVKLGASELRSTLRIFESAAQFDEKIRALRADPRYQRHVAHSSLAGIRARIRRGVARNSFEGAFSARPALAKSQVDVTRSRPFERVRPVVGLGPRSLESDVCRDIAEQIYLLTKQYEDAMQMYEQLLIEALGVGISVGAPDGVTYNPFASGPYAARLDWAAFVAMSLKIKLDYLAIQYSLNGCWEPAYESGSSGSGSGGSGGSTATSTASCRTEWVVVEVSSDGGASWSTYWEGWATVCE